MFLKPKTKNKSKTEKIATWAINDYLFSTSNSTRMLYNPESKQVMLNWFRSEIKACKHKLSGKEINDMFSILETRLSTLNDYDHEEFHRFYQAQIRIFFIQSNARSNFTVRTNTIREVKWLKDLTEDILTTSVADGKGEVVITDEFFIRALPFLLVHPAIARPDAKVAPQYGIIKPNLIEGKHIGALKNVYYLLSEIEKCLEATHYDRKNTSIFNADEGEHSRKKQLNAYITYSRTYACLMYILVYEYLKQVSHIPYSEKRLMGIHRKLTL